MKSKQSFVILNDRYNTTIDLLSIISIKDVYGIDISGKKINFVLYIQYKSGGSTDQCYYDSEDLINSDLDKLRVLIGAKLL